MPKPWTCALCEATDKGVMVKRAKSYHYLCSWCVAELKRTARGFCAMCKASHPIGDMRGRYCADHNRERNRAYYQKNAERIRAHKTAWRAAHPESMRRTPEQRRAYYARNKQTLYAAHVRYIDKTRERWATYERERRARLAAENPDYWKERRQRAKIATFRRLFRRAS